MEDSTEEKDIEKENLSDKSESIGFSIAGGDEGLFRLLGYINEARAARGEPPLTIEDIADKYKTRPFSARDLR